MEPSVDLKANFSSASHSFHCSPTQFPSQHLSTLTTAIADSGVSGVYLRSGAPYAGLDKVAPVVSVGTVTGQVHRSSAECKLQVPELRELKAHVLPSFQNSLVGLGPLCDAGHSVLFTKESVQVRNPHGAILLTRWLCKKESI